MAAECKRRGDPRVGMTAEQVEATCWGQTWTCQSNSYG
jgi:hypothetical protein